ncbi:MAG: N-acetyltransferase [Mesorhizobium sp.]|nr:MAG: N-acetyltransferase [Mesorhizobium sp.]
MNMIWGTANTPEIRDGLVNFVGSRIEGGERGFGECVAMGVIDGGELLGAVIYHNYNPEAGVIEISGAATHSRWLTRQVLWAMYNYPFNEAGCQMVVQRSSEKDIRLARILTAYGFESYKIARLRGRTEDEIVYTLTDDRWRNNGFHRRIIDGQVQSAVAA